MKLIIFLLSITMAQAQVKSWYQSAPNSQYGLLTQQTIDDLRNISPDIFAALDTLKMPVYVKVLSDKDFKGFSGLSTIEKNCVFIRVIHSVRSTRILAHEFGHVIYQINHPEYVDFYTKRYVDRKGSLGHDNDDGSGKMAFLFEDRHARNSRSK